MPPNTLEVMRQSAGARRTASPKGQRSLTSTTRSAEASSDLEASVDRVLQPHQAVADLLRGQPADHVLRRPVLLFHLRHPRRRRPEPLPPRTRRAPAGARSSAPVAPPAHAGRTPCRNRPGVGPRRARAALPLARRGGSWSGDGGRRTGSVAVTTVPGPLRAAASSDLARVSTMNRPRPSTLRGSSGSPGSSSKPSPRSATLSTGCSWVHLRETHIGPLEWSAPLFNSSEVISSASSSPCVPSAWRARYSRISCRIAGTLDSSGSRYQSTPAGYRRIQGVSVDTSVRISRCRSATEG